MGIILQTRQDFIGHFGQLQCDGSVNGIWYVVLDEWRDNAFVQKNIIGQCALIAGS